MLIDDDAHSHEDESPCVDFGSVASHHKDYVGDDEEDER
jgi:hypothetical protein